MSVLVSVIVAIFFFLLVSVLSFLFFGVFFLMIRRPPRSTLDRSSAASDVYKRQGVAGDGDGGHQGEGGIGRRGEIGHQLEHFQPVHAATMPAVTVILEGVEAVSYTHLRAHETVLDLVCRLLLEKKNTTSSSTVTTTAIQD